MNKIVLQFILIFWFASLPSLGAAEWYRCAIHAHSNWSDGNVTLEEAVEWYSSHGFHFVSITDHRILQTDPNRWRDVSQEKADELNAKFGAGWTEIRIVDGKLQMRSKTVWEMEKKFNKPGRFLVIPGLELTERHVWGDESIKALHLNALNVAKTLPYAMESTLEETIRRSIKEVREHGESEKRPTILIVNHPQYLYYDIPPKALIDIDEVEFYEFLNPDYPLAGGVPLNESQFWTIENYWDIVNAFRTVAGKQFVYGVGVDDAHDYTSFTTRTCPPGIAWIDVRAEELTAGAIFSAMRKGDFTISTGVELNDVRFDQSAKTLAVDIRPEEGVKYQIDFVGTKKNFDRTETSFVLDEKAGTNPKRTGYTYRFEDFGVILKSVEGTKGEYTMRADDLYVRARITSDRRTRVPNENEPPTASAWTQPYR